MTQPLRTRHLTWLPVLALASACGTEAPQQLGSVHVKSALIGAAAGGELAVSATDYAPFAGLKVQIPAGALAQDTKITVDVAAGSLMDADATAAGPAVDLGPSGTTFSKPVTITLPVADAVDVALARVYVRHGDGTREVLVPEALTYDAAAGALVFTVQHFTTYEPGVAHDRCRHNQCPAECTEQECDPAPGAPNYTCSDGTLAGPFCRRDPAGVCGWEFVTCPVACAADADCAAGQICVNGGCASSPVETCGTAVCPAGLLCCNPSCGICAPPDGACTQQACVQECQADSDCPAGEVCDPSTGTCQPSTPGEVCGNNTCAEGTFCCNPSCGICAPLGGGCTEQACLACASDADCDPATSCINGYCR
jgi:Cys-rich repeat protein